MALRLPLPLALLAVLATGCTHHQLRFNTVRQAETVADIHTKQVLDNVAKFVENPHALPHFSYPTSGSSQVTDSGNASADFSFNPFRLTGWGTGFGASRLNSESYSMTPINDPRQLELMRCAYQRAVFGCSSCADSAFCPDCQKRFNNFYLGNVNISKSGELTDQGEAVYRVKPGVNLIYFDDNNEPKPIEDDSGLSYVVRADRTQMNEVLYRLLRVEGDGNSDVPIGVGLFKRDNSPFRSITELEVAVEQAEKSGITFPFAIEVNKKTLTFEKLASLLKKGLVQEVDGILYAIVDEQEQVRLLTDAAREVEELRNKFSRSTNGPESPNGAKAANEGSPPFTINNLLETDSPLEEDNLLESESPAEESSVAAFNTLIEFRRNAEPLVSAMAEELGPDTQFPLGGPNAMLSLGPGTDPNLIPDLMKGVRKELLATLENADRAISKFEVAAVLPVSLQLSDLSRLYTDLTVAERTRRTGIVTTACLVPQGWFCKGTMHQALRSGSSLIGRHGKTAIWVKPCGRSQLTKLTLTVLDIATGESPASAKTEVFAFVGADGSSTTDPLSARFVARGEVTRGRSVSSILPSSTTFAAPPSPDEARLLNQVRDALRKEFLTLVRDSNIFPVIEQTISDLRTSLAQQAIEEVRFVDEEFRTQTVQAEEGDLLIPLAAQIVNKAISLNGLNDADEKELSAAARAFLEASLKLERLSPEAQGKEPVSASESSPSRNRAPSMIGPPVPAVQVIPTF